MAAVSTCMNASKAGIFLREVAAVPEVKAPTVVATSCSARCGLQYSIRGPGLLIEKPDLQYTRLLACQLLVVESACCLFLTIPVRKPLSGNWEGHHNRPGSIYEQLGSL